MKFALWIRWLRLGSVMLLLGPVGTAAQITSIDPLPGWRESFEERRPVGGGAVIVGLVTGPGQQRVQNPRRFWVYVPGSLAVRLCVRISSLDGRYRAELHYNVRPERSDDIELHLPTRYSRQLSSYTEKQLAIVVREAHCRSNQLFVSSWRGPDRFMSNGVTAFLRIDDAQEVRISGNRDRSIICNEINGEQMAYNYECFITSPGPAWLESFSIQQRDMDTFLASGTFRFSMP